MAAQESNVVAFETLQAKQKDTFRRNETRMIAECRTILSDRLGELLQGYFAKLDDELFTLSDKAENSTQQSVYFEAMRYMRRERDDLQTQYMQELLQQYDDFWRQKPTPVYLHKDTPIVELSEDSFALVENETLEEDLAINTMIEKGGNLFHRDLFVLGKRFGALLNRDDVLLENNPISPAAICHCFENALKPKTLDLKVRLIIYKLFDRQVMSAFAPVYQDINAYLAGEGILPTIAKSFKRTPGSLAGSIHSDLEDAAQKIAHAAERADAGENAPYLEAFQAMQSLLDGWRTQLGLSSFASSYQGSGPVFEAGEVLNALSVLQHPAQLPTDKDSIGSDGLKLYVTNQLGKLQPDGSARPLGRLEEDTIDMVAMVFDFILEDKNLPAPVKALIARLQIPLVKVAILEKSFFAKKTHPARLLLNSLSQAGIGLDIADGGSDNPIFRKIEDVVSRVLDQFDQDTQLFSVLLDDFTGYVERESQRSGMVEERTRQTTQSKEQVQLSKRVVAYEIALRLRSRSLPLAIKSFLLNAWKDVLVLAYLRRDKDQVAWTHALQVMEKLIWSVTPPANASARQELVQAIPPLLKSIREGLENISFDPLQTSSLLGELENAHMHCLRGGQPISKPELLTDVSALTKEVAIKDAELAEAISEIKSNLPDIEEIRIEDVGVEFGEKLVLGSLNPSQQASGDQYLTMARGLGIGEWVEFYDDAEKALRAKLSWKSQVTSAYVFVNRKGVKVVQMNAGELAIRLRAGTARIVEGGNVPLMDRALSALMSSLKNPSKKTETPS